MLTNFTGLPSRVSERTFMYCVWLLLIFGPQARLVDQAVSQGPHRQCMINCPCKGTFRFSMLDKQNRDIGEDHLH